MNKQQLQDYIFNTYGISPDFPFDNDFETAVYRHRNNRKWFGIVINVKKSKLGLSGEDTIDVVNIKCHRDVIDSMWQEVGIFPAYHMNRSHWLSLALDGSADDDTIRWLVGMSFELTATKDKSKKKQTGDLT